MHLFPEPEGDACRHAPAAHRQQDVVRQLAQLFLDLHGDGGLAFDHIGIVERRQEIPAFLRAPLLRGGQADVEIVADQVNLDIVAAEHPGLLDLLLRRGDGHEDHAALAHVAAHEGDALGMVPGRGANEQLLIRLFAHCVQRAADLVGTDRAQVLALEVDVRAETFGQMHVALQRRCGKHIAHRLFGGAGLGLEIAHVSFSGASPPPRQEAGDKHT